MIFVSIFFLFFFFLFLTFTFIFLEVTIYKLLKYLSLMISLLYCKVTYTLTNLDKN